MRKPPLVITAVLAFFGVFYALFAWFGLHAFPFSGDEYSYLLQGQIFARGKLHTAAPPHAELLGVDHVVIDQWVRSKYPPGTSALLALGVLAGAPWLVTPLEGVVALALVWKGARPMLGHREALISVALLGAAPLFAFQAASFYAQTATTMWLAAALAAISGWTLDARSWRLVLAGAAVGCALLTRPLDAFIFFAALVAFRSMRVFVLAGLGVAPFLVAELAYQAVQFGSPFTDGYRAYQPTFRAIYGHEAVTSISLAHLVSPEQLWHHLDVTRAFLVDWTVPGTALLALLGGFALRKVGGGWRPVERFVLWWIGLTFGVLLFTYAGYDDGARARYLSTALVPAVWLAGPGWGAAARALEERIGRRPARFVGAAVALVAPIQLGAFLVIRTPEIWVREGLKKAVAAQRVADGVVIVRAMYPTRYARNGPFFDRPVLYLSAARSVRPDDVAAAFPGRPVYEAWEGQEWTMARVK